jgi:hypothetical protein
VRNWRFGSACATDKCLSALLFDGELRYNYRLFPCSNTFWK